MAQVTLSPGNWLVPFIGAAAVRVDSQPWFTAANVDVYAVATNLQSYAKNPGGSNQAYAPAAAIQFTPSATVLPNCYILVVKQAFSIDSTLFGAAVATANPVRLYAAFPAGGTSVVPVTLTQGDQPGSYLVDAAAPGTGISGLAYVKNGVAVTVSTSTALALAAGDVLTITGTTAGAAGLLALLKQ